MLSEIERDEIYGEPKEIDGDTIIWESRGNKDRFYLKVPVRRANGEEMHLRAYYGARRYSFALLYRGTILIRRWDFERHENPGPDGSIFNGVPHKHKWTEEYGDEWAYTVDDVPVNDVELALKAFLTECNISVIGPTQQSLFSIS
ncbi:DUF6978 family protein [Syntrophomonas wolfei]|uniref:DUF6978 family protein n=1 Tax=Syntrophomonas wolfei TaxID=863 RepID=UPI000773116E|nr:hypothetical protein [Syntrophomonas wolfei]